MFTPGRDAANLAIAWISSTESLNVGITGTRISYTDSTGHTYNLWEGEKNSLILTYNRATGGFLPIQSNEWEQNQILEELRAGNDIPLERDENLPYCQTITVKGGMRTREITLNKDTGKYTIAAK